MSSDGRIVPITMPNQAVPLRSTQANGLGKRSSWAMARDVSVTMSVQPLSAPMPEMTATAAMNLGAQASWGNIVWKALTNGDPVLTRVPWATRPMTAAVTSTYRTALSAVPISDERPTLMPGLRTRLAVTAAASTPMKENSATPAAMPMPLYRLPPEALNAPKWALLTKNHPTTPTNSNGRNLRTTVTFWNHAIWRTPAKLMAAGTHKPNRAIPQFSIPVA